MYGDAFCRVYNEFGWNYFPEAFAHQLIEWMRSNEVQAGSCLDLGCGTGVLCEVLHGQGIDVRGMDLSESMIKVAKERMPQICYEVGDMITYLPDRKFDLVTCTGDALNHIISPEDVGRIFRNVYSYLNDGGYFIFDVLSDDEVPDDEPFDLDFSDEVRAQFQVTRTEDGMIQLKTSVYENGSLSFEEKIFETVHDIGEICRLLGEAHFTVERCSHKLLEENPVSAATWYVIARRDG